MPQRVIRDWTDSEKINTISSSAECLFVRLMMKADDFGNFHANVKLVKSLCFPLKDYRESDITRWMNELKESGLIAFYMADNKKYLTILKFGQRLRNMRNTFPKPSENDNMQQIAASCGECPPETNRSRNEEEGEEEGEEKRAHSQNLDQLENLFPEEKKYEPSEQVKTGSEEKEKSSAKKEKVNPPDLDSFLNVAREIYQNELKVDFTPYSFAVTAKYNSWVEAGWKDGHKKPIEGWKNKLRNVIPYLKPFNQNSQNGSSQARRR